MSISEGANLEFSNEKWRCSKQRTELNGSRVAQADTDYGASVLAPYPPTILPLLLALAPLALCPQLPRGPPVLPLRFQLLASLLPVRGPC